MGRRLVMVITGFFPPAAGVGVRRPLGLCRHLAAGEWDVTVVTARPGPEERTDAGLLDAVPSGVRVIRTGAPDLPVLAARALKPAWVRRLVRRDGRPDPSGAGRDTVTAPPVTAEQRAGGESVARRCVDWASWWLHVPDGRSAWLLPGLRAALTEAARRRPDVVFSTAPFWTAHVVAAGLCSLLRLPLVADFRDPWCGSAFRPIPYRAHRRASEGMEATVVRLATRVTCAWEGIARHLRARYPDCAGRILTIRNGYDAARVDTQPPIALDARRCVLLHAGSFYGPRSPVPLFEALGLLKRDIPDLADRLLVALVGLASYNGQRLDELARAHGVGDSVRVVGPVSQARAVGLLKGADAALLFGQSGSESLASVPAKAYEYIGTGRSVLAIGAGGEVCSLLAEAGCGVWRADADRPGEIADALREILDLHRRGALPVAPPELRKRFTRARMARRLDTVLLEAASARASATGRKGAASCLR